MLKNQCCNSNCRKIIRPLIPKPLQYVTDVGEFKITNNTCIYVSANTIEERAEISKSAKYFTNILNLSTGFNIDIINSNTPKDYNIFLTTLGTNIDLGNEGYMLKVTPCGVALLAYKPEGIFRGLQTLLQLLPPEAESHTLVNCMTWNIPCSTIIDKPTYSFRGTMLDVARHFFNIEDVKRQIDLVARFKINKFHLHLSDDQGWRLEIKSWPCLTTIGGSTEVGGGPGGYYTQDEFKELIEYAKERYIEIIPEFDMPSHINAALASYGELNPDGIRKPLYTGIDVGFSSLMTNEEITYKFVNDVIREIASISPSPYIHIGGDEAHSTSFEDYNYFIGRAVDIIRCYGKRAIGWDPFDSSNGVHGDSVLQKWNVDAGSDAVSKCMNIIASPATKAYLDMMYNKDSKYGLKWAGFVSSEDSYNWDPTKFVPATLILGVEAPLWTETIDTLEAMDYMTFPRLPGIAEIGWTPTEMRTWEEYKTRIKLYSERLKIQGVQFYKDPTIW